MQGINFKAFTYGTGCLSIPEKQLEEQATLPCVVWWNQVHFVVVYKLKKNKVYVANPTKGKIRYTKEEFLGSVNRYMFPEKKWRKQK